MDAMLRVNSVEDDCMKHTHTHGEEEKEWGEGKDVKEPRLIGTFTGRAF